MHWSADYLGKPWISGARGPDAFDCWGLLRDVYAKQFGIELPLYPGLDAENLYMVIRVFKQEEGDWEELELPEDGCAVGMAQGARDSLHHVGVYIDRDGGFVLHSSRENGAITTPLKRLPFFGWSKIHFYRHKRNGVHL